MGICPEGDDLNSYGDFMATVKMAFRTHNHGDL
jgi:hypothetical protein